MYSHSSFISLDVFILYSHRTSPKKSGEDMQEVPDRDILEDDAMDAEVPSARRRRDSHIDEDDDDNVDNFVDYDGEDDDYDTDGDYIDGNTAGEDEAAAVLFGNRDNQRRSGGGGGRGGGGRGRGGGRRRRNDDEEEEEEDEGEDLLENAHKDYRAIAALDTYGCEGIDDRDYGAMDADKCATAPLPNGYWNSETENGGSWHAVEIGHGDFWGSREANEGD